MTTGSVPGVRAGHTMNMIGSKLYVFGGGDGNHYLNDLHILDTGTGNQLKFISEETMSWSQAYVTGSSPA
ncbi:hypothetical protein JG630_18010, partial [Vibrio cholerae]|uniref:Kelch repeat-containing protein n=1 Tax=Vibrio cholerae TaxID=666 RepID=UPI0018F0C327